MSGMPRRMAKVIALTVIAVCAVAVLAGVVVAVRAPDDPHPTSVIVIGDPSTERVAELRAEVEADIAASGRPVTEDATPDVGIVLVVVLCFGWIGVGALIVSRQPHNWAGWTFIAIGAPLPLFTLAQSLVLVGARLDPGSVPGLDVLAVFGEYALYPVALLPLLFLLYPDGHVPSPRWRWAVRGLLGGTALALLGFLLRPGPLNNWIDIGVLYVNPTGIEGFADPAGLVIAIGGITALVAALSTVVAVTQRFRRSTGEARQQMRVLALVAALAGGGLAVQIVFGLIGIVFGIGEDDSGAAFDILFGVTVFTLVIGTPAAYLVAIFRHGLWDLDVVIRKTVQYGVLVVALVAIGFVVVVAVPTLVVGLGSGTGFLPTLLLAGVLSAAFLWVRPRAARLADRLVYGRRATPYEILSEFSGRVGETYATEDVLPRMAQLVAGATGARRADVWVRMAATLRPVGTWPTDASTHPARSLSGQQVAELDGEVATEVRHQGVLLGAITLEPSLDDPMNPTKEALVGDLASQAGLLLNNVLLIEELRASRQRLVAAQDAERRKLERNIHDGVQQQLVALNVQLGLLASMATRDPARAASIATDLQARATSTLEDLRDLARGIYPPLLADQGLEAALASQARKAAIPTAVRADAVGRYAQEVEAAVYFSVLEALNNAAKYAGATSAEISLAQRNGSLAFAVTDDGSGFDPATVERGTGLQGIVDRLDAIGGDVSIESAPGSGTTVRGNVPVA